MENQEQPFPQTLLEAIQYFSDADNCLNFMIKIRWADGPVCPRCESKQANFIKTRRLWICKDCKKNFTVKQGTVMEDSPIGLDKWLAAIWMIANDKNGISSYEIHRGLGITQKSAWFLLHRIRLAMQNGSLNKLSGTTEADETFIGGKARFMRKDKRAAVIKGRGASGKTIVMGILERQGDVRTKVVPDTTKETLQGEVRANVEAGAEVFTDQNPSYKGLALDYLHDSVNHDADEYVRGRVHTQGIDNFWSLVKRALKGTYISVMPFHLFRYLDEQGFRYNNRKFNDCQRFLMVCNQISGRRLTYRKLTGQTILREGVEPTALDTLFPL
jgi:transposase-like protein